RCSCPIPNSSFPSPNFANVYNGRFLRDRSCRMWPAVQTCKSSTTSSAVAGSKPRRPSSSTSTTLRSATSSDGPPPPPAPTTPLSTGADVDAAVRPATDAFPGWRDTPVNARAQVLYRFKALLEENFEEMARIVTTEHGKTLDEARGSVRRGIECVEVACGAPSLMQGFGLEDIA